MGAAVAVVADVVWSAAVGAAAQKVVQKVAPKLGIGKDGVKLLGIAAGAYAGGSTFGQASSVLQSAGMESAVNPLVSPAVEAVNVDKVSSVVDGGSAASGSFRAAQDASMGAAAQQEASRLAAGGGGYFTSDRFKEVGAKAVSDMAGTMIDAKMRDDLEARKLEEQRRVEELDRNRIRAWQQSAEQLPPRALRNFRAPPVGPYQLQAPVPDAPPVVTPTIQLPQIRQGGLLKRGM